MPENSSPTKRTSHVNMGLYRLLLSFFVFSSHLYKALIPVVFDSGILGVCCFFVVSGWVIANVASTTYAGRPISFIVNRATRIYPSLWAALLLAVMMLALSGRESLGYLNVTNWHFADVLSAALIVPAYPISKWGPLPSGWSLTVEMAFYLVVFFAAVFRFSLRSIAWFALAIFIIISPFPKAWENPFIYIPFFVLGIAFHLKRSDERRSDEWLLWAALLLSCLGLSLIVQPGSARWLPAQMALFLAMMWLLARLPRFRPKRTLAAIDRIAGD